MFLILLYLHSSVIIRKHPHQDPRVRLHTQYSRHAAGSQQSGRMLQESHEKPAEFTGRQGHEKVGAH